MAARWSIPQVYTDYRVLIDAAEVDAVIIATSNASHYQICMAALNAGFPSLCEKPLALSYPEAAELASRAQELGLGLRLHVDQLTQLGHMAPQPGQLLVDVTAVGP